MTRTPIRPEPTRTQPAALSRHRALVDAALRDCIAGLPNPTMRLIASYQLGWCDENGLPTSGHSGKALRPAITLLAAEAAGGDTVDAVPAAAAVELIHNFSLLHDDVMDGDTERRHRPTGWAAFGTGAAILAGNAMLVAAAELVATPDTRRMAALAYLLRATQQLISGQSEDLRLESARDVDLDEVLEMEAGKTGALLECAASIGAVSVGAGPEIVRALAGYGSELGVAFQLVDDVLGLVGDPKVTGKPRCSDVRAGKRTAPIVAALRGTNPAGRELGVLLADGPPQNEAEVELAARLVEDAGGLEWAVGEARRRLRLALAHLHGAALRESAVADLTEIGHYVVERQL